MNLRQSPSKFLLIPLLLFVINIGSKAYSQTLNLSKSVEDVTTGGDGSVASQYDTLEYTIILNNLSSSNITGATLFDNIPAGVSYVPGSTTLNGVSVADVSSKMPYSNSGGLVNSPLYGPGILAPNVAATIIFRVKVTANGGSITNYAALKGTYNATGFIQNTNTVFTNLTPDATCSTIYQSTAVNVSGNPSAYLYKNFRTLNTTNGTCATTAL